MSIESQACSEGYNPSRQRTKCANVWESAKFNWVLWESNSARGGVGTFGRGRVVLHVTNSLSGPHLDSCFDPVKPYCCHRNEFCCHSFEARCHPSLLGEYRSRPLIDWAVTFLTTFKRKRRIKWEVTPPTIDDVTDVSRYWRRELWRHH